MEVFLGGSELKEEESVPNPIGGVVTVVEDRGGRRVGGLHFLS